MNIDNIKINSVHLLRTHLPKLFDFINDKDLYDYIDSSLKFSKQRDGQRINANFSKILLDLATEVKVNNRWTIRNEMYYINSLFDQFVQLEESRSNFKNLIKSALFNHNDQNFLNVIGELGACYDLCRKYQYLGYEIPLNNGYSIDFKFGKRDGDYILVEILNSQYDPSKYEDNDSFERLIIHRLTKKITEKKILILDKEIIDRIYIFPIIHGITPEIIKANHEFLNSIEKNDLNGVKCINPKYFGSIGKKYSLLSTEEIFKWP